MGDHPLVLIDRDRARLFSSLTHARGMLSACTWTDPQGIAWTGGALAGTSIGCTWLGPGWVFDNQAQEERAEEYQRGLRKMLRADESRHQLKLRGVLQRLRLGGQTERVLWALHACVMAHRSALLCLSDVWLASC